VTLPTDIVTYEGEEPPAVMPQRSLDEAPVQESTPAPVEVPEVSVPEAERPAEDMIVLHDDDLVVLDESDDDVDSLLDELVDDTPIEVPEEEDFDRGLQSMVDEQLPPGPVESDIPGTPPIEPRVPAASEAEPPPPAKEAQPAGITVAEQITAAARAEAKAADMTAAGLVKRTPKKKSADAEWTPPNAEAAPVKSTGQSHRSPEEVRKMLSRYRSGLNRGKSGTVAPTDNKD